MQMRVSVYARVIGCVGVVIAGRVIVGVIKTLIKTSCQTHRVIHDFIPSESISSQIRVIKTLIKTSIV